MARSWPVDVEHRYEVDPVSHWSDAAGGPRRRHEIAADQVRSICIILGLSRLGLGLGVRLSLSLGVSVSVGVGVGLSLSLGVSGGPGLSIGLSLGVGGSLGICRRLSLGSCIYRRLSIRSSLSCLGVCRCLGLGSSLDIRSLSGHGCGFDLCLTRPMRFGGDDRLGRSRRVVGIGCASAQQDNDG